MTTIKQLLFTFSSFIDIRLDVIVQLFFGAEFKAQYLPWVLCAFNHIVVGSGFPDLLGIFVGHVYYFLKFRYAQDFGGPDLLRTPQVKI